MGAKRLPGCPHPGFERHETWGTRQPDSTKADLFRSLLGFPKAGQICTLFFGSV